MDFDYYLVNAIRGRLMDAESLLLFDGLLSGSPRDYGSSVAEYFIKASEQIRMDSPELFSAMEKAPSSKESQGFYSGLGRRPEPFTDIWRCYFDSGIVKLSQEEFFVDCGAEELFSSYRFAKLTHGKYRGILALEPAPDNFEKCRMNAELFDARLELRRLAVGGGSGKRRFSACGAGSRFDQNGELDVETASLDELLSGKRPSFIKLHLEGAELEAVEGAESTIRRCGPRLAICLHRFEDAASIPARLLKYRPDYRLWLRHYSTGPEETVLYADTQV